MRRILRHFSLPFVPLPFPSKKIINQIGLLLIPYKKANQNLIIQDEQSGFSPHIQSLIEVL